MTDPHDTAEALLAVSNALDPLVDMVAGYRAKLELAGYSPSMAEAMSAQLHGQMVARIIGGDQ